MLLAVSPLWAPAIAFDPLPPRTPPRRVLVHNQWARVMPYAEALAWQRELHGERVQLIRDGKPPLPDALLLMQHPPVLTLGTARCAPLGSSPRPSSNPRPLP